MLSPALLIAFTAFVSSGSAANTIKFVNHCPYDVYSWTVGPVGSGYAGLDRDAVTIPANSVTDHGMINGETIGGGITLKLRDLPKYRVAPAGIIQVEYNLELSNNTLWYDLSTIDCVHSAGPESPSFCPLISSGMKIYVKDADYGRCPPIWCSTDGCHNAYKTPGFRQKEPTFRCDAGAEIVVEFCTERAGPRTFNGHSEPGHSAEPQPDTKPGHPTTNGVCGSRTPDGATCFGFAHGKCCSQYGWCGFSQAHCGEGCQHGFGDCFGQPLAQPSVYQPPAKPSSVQPSYEKSTSSSAKVTPSYYPPVSSYSHPGFSYYPSASSYTQQSSTHTPKYSYTQHTWPSYSKPTSSYAKPSTIKSTPVYSKPTFSYDKPTPSYYSPASSYTPPVEPSHSSVYSPAPSHSKSTPIYSAPTPTYNIPAPPYSAPSSSYVQSTPIYSAPTPIYPPPYRTIYATHTVTETREKATTTVTLGVGSEYSAPSTSSEYYEISTEVEDYAPTTSSVYNVPSTSSEYYGISTGTEDSAPTTSSVYRAPTTRVYSVPTTSILYNTPNTSSEYYEIPTIANEYAPVETHAVYYPPWKV